MILDKIVDKKKKKLKGYDYKNKIDKEKNKSFYNAIAKNGISIIGEIKRSSPSKGDINKNVNIEKVTEIYNQTVDAISVLTEEDFFNGKINDLIKVKKNSDLPVLRKDFIINKNQILESRNIGADAILLIVAILDRNKLLELYSYACDLGLDAIVEVHNEKELEVALSISPKIIGINNRNLIDFSIDLNTTNKLRKKISKDILVISESGIKEKEDLLKIDKVNGLLIGESFMKSKSIEKKAKEFKSLYDTKG